MLLSTASPPLPLTPGDSAPPAVPPRSPRHPYYPNHPPDAPKHPPFAPFPPRPPRLSPPPPPPHPHPNPPPWPAAMTIQFLIMMTDVDLSLITQNSLVDDFKEDTCNILSTNTGAPRCSVYALSPGSIVMGAQLMADSTSQVLPIYLNITAILRDDATPYFQPSGFLKKYGVGTVYGQVLTLFDIPPPPTPPPVVIKSPPPAPPQKITVTDASQAPSQVANNPGFKSSSTSSSGSGSGGSVGLMAAIAVLGCVVLSACAAIFIMLRKNTDNRIHVEIGDSPIYAQRREVSEGGTSGPSKEEEPATGFVQYRKPLPPSGPRNQTSIYFPGGTSRSSKSSQDQPRLRSSAGGKSQSSNGGRGSSGGGNRKEAQQPEPYKDNTSRWI